MAKLLGIEILFMILIGLFAAFGIPAALGYPPAWPLFLVGFLMTMSFIGLYAIANLGGRKMKPAARTVVGLLSFAAAFYAPILLAAGALFRGERLGVVALTNLLPVLPALLLPAVAALKAKPGQRGEAASWALYAYTFPSVGIWWVLLRLVEINPMAVLIAVHAGALYLFLRGLLRIFMPTAAEGNPDAAPLVLRPVPDQIVGLVEGTTRRRARPYATRADGSLDESAISILCRPEDLPGVSAKLQDALGSRPFTVETGQPVSEGQVELVIRPIAPTAPARP